MNRTKVAIFGMGQVARVRHVEGYKRNPDSEVVAVFDRNPERAKYAQKLGISNAYSNLEQLYNEIEFEAVSICTPPFTHKDMVISALQHNKHVLCEKPISMKPDDISEINAIKPEHLIFSTCHNFLFGKAVSKLEHLRNEGKTGDVIGATAIQWSSWNRRLPTWYDQLPGGLFYDEGPHLLYLIEHFLGELKVLHSAFTQPNFSGKPSEHVSATYEGDRGICQMTMWFGAPQSEWILAVGFEKGSAIIDLFRDILIFLPHEKTRNYKYILEVPFKATIQEWQSIIHWMSVRLSKGRHLYGHQKIIDDFISAIRTGSKPIITYNDGYRILGVMHETLRMAGVHAP